MEGQTPERNDPPAANHAEGPSAGGIGEARRWLLGGFVAGREQVLDELVATAVDHRADDDVADFGLLRAGMGEVFDMFLACAVELRDLISSEIAFFERLGAVRCEQGAEIEVVTGEFRTAFDHCYCHLATLAGDRPVAAVTAALRELTPSLYRLRDTALETIEGGHKRQARRLADTSTGEQAGLLRALLAGNPRQLET